MVTGIVKVGTEPQRELFFASPTSVEEWFAVTWRQSFEGLGLSIFAPTSPPFLTPMQLLVSEALS